MATSYGTADTPLTECGSDLGDPSSLQQTGGAPFRNGSSSILSKSHFTLRRRHFVAAMAFLGFANIYMMRANLSVAIVQMTTPIVVGVTDAGLPVSVVEFGWGKPVMGYLLAAFFAGYIFTQIIGGHYAHLHGGKTVFLMGVLGTAIFTTLSPPMARLGWGALVLARFLEGLCEGVTYPAIHVLWSAWAPLNEKTKLATFAFAGSYFGTVVCMPLSAWLGDRFGWPAIFYAFGVVALIWCFGWAKCVADRPEHDSHISTDELMLLQNDAAGSSYYIVPWREVLRSRPVWAVVAAHTAENWGFYTMLTSLPLALRDLAHYDVEESGWATSLPYLLMGSLLIGCGVLSDRLLQSTGWSLLRTRRTFCCAGFALQIVFLLLASLASSSPLLMVTYISLSVGLGGAVWAGFSVNHLDLAPNYAGHLMALSNTVATLPGILAPLLVGWSTQNGAASEWRFVFYTTAFFYALGAMIFHSWSAAEVQPWAIGQAPIIRHEA